MLLEFFHSGNSRRNSCWISMELHAHTKILEQALGYIDFKYSMHWSVFSAGQISLQKHYGMVVGFCVSCFLTVMQILTVIIANCLKVHTVAVPSVFLRRQEELGLIY
nr:unnamed protein product [Ipomoea batatas]